MDIHEIKTNVTSKLIRENRRFDIATFTKEESPNIDKACQFWYQGFIITMCNYTDDEENTRMAVAIKTLHIYDSPFREYLGTFLRQTFRSVEDAIGVVDHIRDAQQFFEIFEMESDEDRLKRFGIDIRQKLIELIYTPGKPADAIAAIKEVRKYAGIGLRASKMVVDMIMSNPKLFFGQMYFSHKHKEGKAE